MYEVECYMKKWLRKDLWLNSNNMCNYLSGILSKLPSSQYTVYGMDRSNESCTGQKRSGHDAQFFDMHHVTGEASQELEMVIFISSLTSNLMVLLSNKHERNASVLKRNLWLKTMDNVKRWSQSLLVIVIINLTQWHWSLLVHSRHLLPRNEGTLMGAVWLIFHHFNSLSLLLLLSDSAPMNKGIARNFVSSL